VIASDYDRAFELAFLNQVVHRQTELRALSIAEPANSCGQTLELDSLAGEADPAAKNVIVREHFQNQIVGDGDVRGLTGKRDPAERPPAFAEERAYVGGHKSRETVGILYALLKGEGADVVAVVESNSPHLLQS